MAVKPSWRGRTFEEFEVGDLYDRTIMVYKRGPAPEGFRPALPAS